MKQDADWKILATLSFLVATVAIPTVVSLISPETVEASPANTVKAPASNSATVEETSREPASVDSHVISFDVRCAKGKTATSQNIFKTAGAYIQLKGRDCSKHAAETPIRITNKTNGFTASIFQVSNNEYQTDLIQLKDGENQISIQFKAASGGVEEDLLQIKANEI